MKSTFMRYRDCSRQNRRPLQMKSLSVWMYALAQNGGASRSSAMKVLIALNSAARGGKFDWRTLYYRSPQRQRYIELLRGNRWQSEPELAQE